MGAAVDAPAIARCLAPVLGKMMPCDAAVAEKTVTRASPPRHLSNIKTSFFGLKANVTPTPAGVKI
jgi:hypothetical protein